MAKPAGMTSHDVVARLRRLTRRDLNTKKVGHAGTLDPMATGVLIACIGSATRLSEYAMHHTKRYRAVMRLGVTTTTEDADGATLQTRDASAITRADIECVLPGFTGDLQQIPPMYSAIRQDGKRLHELARAGQTVERPSRPVTIHALKLLDYRAPDATLDVTCGSGTYIRSLARDIGEALGVGAHLVALTRTASGRFTLDEASPLDALMDDPNWQARLLPPRAIFADWHTLHTDADAARRLSSGQFLPRDPDSDPEWAIALRPDGALLAILRARDARWKPHKVISPVS